MRRLPFLATVLSYHIHLPAVDPCTIIDHEELAAVEAFNREMAELEDLEHQEELRLLLQDRLSGK